MKFLRVGVGTVLFALAAVFCADCVAQAMGFEIAAFSFLHGWGANSGMLLCAPLLIAPFPVDPALSATSIMYKNTQYIADMVLPRTPVSLQNFKYRSYAKGTFLTIPETLVSRTGAPNRVEVGFTEVDSSTVDHALDDIVPVVDINNAPPNYNPLAAAVEFITQLLLVDREKRTADMVFNIDNYAAGNKTTLVGGDQFSDADSTPVDVIQDAIDACFYRPNRVVMGRAVASALFKHADIVKAVNGTLGDTGIVRRQAFADLFEFDQVLIGEGWYNTAKPGQTPTMARVWGKSMLLYYSDPSASATRGVTFGVTAQFGSRIAGQEPDSDAGMRGGIKVRAGESVRELILANDLGYLIDAAVA